MQKENIKSRIKYVGGLQIIIVFALMLAILGSLIPVVAFAAGTTLAAESVGTLSVPQDAAIYNGKIFVPNTSGSCTVYELSSRNKLGTFTFDKTSAIVPHGNTACFGNTFYQESDKYPLLYVSLWNRSETTKGTCCVYRITEDETGTFSSTLVQVIKIGFVDNETLWTPSGSTRPYGTFVVDTDNSKLYVAVTRDVDAKTRYFEFAIPALAAGTANETYGCNVVTLTENDIVRRFDSDFTNYQQGITYHDGKIYATAGFVRQSVPAALYIVDLATATTTDSYTLQDYSLSSQPCWISADPATGNIYYGSDNGNMYLLKFTTSDPDHEHSYTASTVLPTCVDQGYTLHKCECGDSYKDNYMEAGHKYVKGVCSVCNNSILSDEWIVPDFAEGDYSMVAIPDPQRLVEKWPEKYYALTQWIADNKTNHNIQAVMYMGDMVHKTNTDLDAMYAVSKTATATLDSSGIPWMPMMGNHDTTEKFNQYYDYETFGSERSWFGGSYYADKLDHTYWFVTVGDREYMILSLGYDPSDAVLQWAKGIVKDNADKNVILTTHEYIDKNGAFSGRGEKIWNTFSSYDNIVLSMCGHLHTPDIVTRTDKNGAEEDVTAFLLDRQNDDADNHYAMIALFTFDEDSDEVSVNWYSTYYDALYKPKNQFLFNVPHIECEHNLSSEILVAAGCTNPATVKYSCTKCSYSYEAVEDISYEDIGDVSAAQDGAVWNGKLFVGNLDGLFRVYNAQTYELLGTFEAENADALTPHCNTVVFGNTYYEQGDKYPLLYANIWKNYSNDAEKHEGTCCVYRIIETDGVFSADLVQVIEIGFVDEENIWPDSNNVRPFGSFIIDTDKSKLYVYANRDSDQDTRFFEFDIPDVTDGTYNETYGCKVVSLAYSAVQRDFSVGYIAYPQCAVYANGELYITSGFVSQNVSPKVTQVDLCSGSVEYVYDLEKAGLTKQPTLLAYDTETDTFIYGTDTAQWYELDLKVIGHTRSCERIAPTCTEKGYYSHVCENCGDVYKDAFVNENGHTKVKDSAVPATCTATGLTEGEHCSVCREILVPQETVPVLDHTYGNWKINTESHWKECNCGNKAYMGAHVDEDKDYYCDDCGYQLERPVEPTTEPATEATTEPTTEPTSNPNDKVDGNPDTGDSSNLVGWIGLMLFGVFGMAAVVLGSKKFFAK